jgi:hypothetical protein
MQNEMHVVATVLLMHAPLAAIKLPTEAAETGSSCCTIATLPAAEPPHC